MTGERCRAAELRTLPLFASLTEAQLDSLCADGRVLSLPAGPLCAEGEPATEFFVLIDGEAVTSKRSAGVDVDIVRTSRRGEFFGVWAARSAVHEHHYDASVRLARASRVFVIGTGSFVRFLRAHLPLALDLRAGHLHDHQQQRESLSRRDMLLALGALTAGLTDQLHTAAAALDRSINGLRAGMGEARRKLPDQVEATFTPEALRVLFSIEDEVAAQVAKYSQQLRPVAGQAYVAPLTADEAAHRRRGVGEWLQQHGIPADRASPATFVDGGVGVDRLECVAASVADIGASGSLPGVVDRLQQTIGTELHIGEIAAACERISALLTGVKQYSQMDRGVYQSVDVHDLLRSTGVMFGDRVAMPGKGAPVTLVKETDLSLPELLCYPGDLNQVWTQLFDNALQAMGGRGTLTVRTMRDGESMIRVEICDDGPGIAPDIIDRVFTAFFTTRPGSAAGLGLDLVRRIVVEKHLGTVAVQSTPGDTRFIVCLPLRAPAPTVRGLEGD